MLGNFSEEAQFVLLKAREEMISLNHPYIGTEHLILSLLKNDDVLAKRLGEYGLNYDNFKHEIISVIGKGTREAKFYLYTPLLKKIMENSLLDAKDNNNGEVTTVHLFSALLEEGEGIAIRILIGMGISLEDLYDEFSGKLIRKPSKRKRKLLIDELGNDLVEKAKKKKMDPVVGRDRELNRVIEILCRRAKNNPILIGEAGVGKTAIVEALSQKIAVGDVPIHLQNKRIISLDMATLVSGTKYRGEFEERMQKILKEVEHEENIILFIDEIHTLVGAGGAEGAIDASNILKPALARGTIHCIGATTVREYKKFIEEDKALDRRFQKVMIEEPSLDTTIQILKKLKPIYEHYHQVKIPDQIISEIVRLSDKYIYYLHNPDKSIDILDEVSSSISIRQTNEGKKLNQLKKERNEIQKVKNSYILDNNLREAYLALKKESALTSAINEFELKNQSCCKVVALEDVAEVIHEKTGIPVYEILKEKVNMVEKLERELKNCVVGQDKAIQELIQATKKMKFGYANHRVKSYLFVGPTGVGKTNLAVSYAKFLNGEKNLIRLDMSEYADATSINKIIGSAPGYVGYEDNNNVLTKIKEKPTAVILLDEIDKANSSVLNLLYQILDVGELTDAKNNTVSFRNNIIIMTSNLGFEESRVGFSQDKCSSLESSLKQKMPLPLLNRIDSVISFNVLTEKDIVCIVKRQLKKLEGKYLDLKLAPNLVLEIVKESNYQQYGARRIAKIIENKVESQIIDRVMNKEKLEVSTLVLQEAK